MHKLPDANGNLISGPKLFTTASVRGILHNPFYTGKVSYQGKPLPGAHEALISQEVFDLVQTNSQEKQRTFGNISFEIGKKIPFKRNYPVCLLRDADVGPNL